MNGNTEKILFLTLRKKWFDMTARKLKREEYREIKPYWAKRLLVDVDVSQYGPKGLEQVCELIKNGSDIVQYDFIDFTHVLLRHGYAKNAPTHVEQIESISVGEAEWSDNWQGNVFILHINKIVERKTLTTHD